MINGFIALLKRLKILELIITSKILKLQKILQATYENSLLGYSRDLLMTNAESKK